MSTEQGNWENLEKRLKGVAEQQAQKGLVIVSVRLMIVNGQLRGWRTPVVQAFEPKGRADILLDHLLGEDE